MRVTDKVWAILAVLGFAIIAGVLMTNAPADFEAKSFVANGYYELPKSDKNVDESDIYSSITGAGKSKTCPATSLELTTNGWIKFGKSGVKYTHNYWITSADSYEDMTEGGTFSDADWDDICKTLHLENVQDSFKFTFAQISCDDPNKSYEIVAPFNFTFGNSNISDDDQIVIYSSDNRFKITFDGIDNWFCAGTPIGDKDTWLQHGLDSNPHYCIYGSSANSKISGGIAGDVIGYAAPNTIVTLECMESSSWIECTVSAWLNS